MECAQDCSEGCSGTIDPNKRNLCEALCMACSVPADFVDDTFCMGEHKKNQNEANRKKHEQGQARKKRDKGGEKGDDRREPYGPRPKGWKGPWPPVN